MYRRNKTKGKEERKINRCTEGLKHKAGKYKK